MEGVVIDTNVFVAAGFNSKSAAARVFEGVREGRFRLIWNEPTRRETEIIVRRIPRLDWASIADLFQPEAEFAGPVDLEAFTAISDPDDRKFAALSAAVNVPLITNDGRVLAEGGAVGIEALTPRAFLERKGDPASYRFISQKTNDRTMLTISHGGPLAERGECR